MDRDEVRAIPRGERFSAEETNVLVREVLARKHVIYGHNGSVPNLQEARRMWDEIGKIVSAIEGKTRTAEKCRRRYNDVRRRGNKRIITLSNCVETGEKSLVLKAEKHHPLDYGILEIGLHAAVKEDSDTEMDYPEEDMDTTLHCQTSSEITLQPEDQPFLDLQQNGFKMLESELQGVRQVMASLNTRMNSMDVVLRPIESIADSLARIANALERISNNPNSPFLKRK